MREYKKPLVQIEKFITNVSVAASCNNVVTGTNTTTVYEKQTVDCLIGGQEETVFNSTSGCSTSATKWGVTEYNGVKYFVWFTKAGDIGNKQPDDEKVAFLDTLVKQLKFDTGSGWHYCDVTGTDIVTDVLGFSY